MANSSERALPPIDLSGSASKVAERWNCNCFTSLVHGKDSEEHDRNLIKVLERLKERGLTVNAEKCTFWMTKVVFIGLLLTRHGIGPTKQKVRAVVEAS